MHLKLSSGKWRPFCLGPNMIIHWGLVTPHGVLKLGYDWCRQWILACSAPSHYLNQWWPIFNLIPVTYFNQSLSKIQIFHSIKCIWKCRLPNISHLCYGPWLTGCDHAGLWCIPVWAWLIVTSSLLRHVAWCVTKLTVIYPAKSSSRIFAKNCSDKAM